MKILNNQEYANFKRLEAALVSRSGNAPTADASGYKPTAYQERRYLAKITGYDETNGYAWKLVLPDSATPGGFVDRDPAETGDNAWERNGSVDVANDTVVEMQLVAYEDDGAARFEFGVGGAGKDAEFLVTLSQDSGGNGGATPGTAPTWTYTLKDYEDGTTVLKHGDGSDATGLSPLAGTRLPAQASAAVTGTAIRKTDGTLVLVVAHEAYGSENCTT